MMSFLLAVNMIKKAEKKKKKKRDISLCAQISMNTPTEWEIGTISALNIFPHNLLLRRLDPMHSSAD